MIRKEEKPAMCIALPASEHVKLSASEGMALPASEHVILPRSKGMALPTSEHVSLSTARQTFLPNSRRTVLRNFVLTFMVVLLLTFTLAACGGQADEVKDGGDSSDAMKERVLSLYGENHEITGKSNENTGSSTGSSDKDMDVAGSSTGSTGSYDENLAVKCSNGTFVGRDDENVVSFKGIPYAEPPTGDLRWKPPVPAEDSDAVFEAYYFGHAPIQTEWPSEPGSYYPQSEDCLTLNVWTNSNNETKAKPVMVFFHGGSYGWGATSDPIYDGHNLVSKFDDIILVTVEFRAGILGFIDFSSVEGGDAFRESGNLGLLDQKCALEWVQKNISAFGGDPDNVTIFGESSGAGSVSLLPLMEGTGGMFRRVIAESGSVALTYSRDECQNLTQMLLEETGCTKMDQLMEISEEDLKKVNEDLNDYNNFPERDGIILPEDPYEAYKAGKSSGIDMMIGTNADEVRYWIWEMGYTVPVLPDILTYKMIIPVLFDNNLKELSAEEKEHVDRFLSMQSSSKTWKLTEFYNETLFRIPAMQQAAYHSDNGSAFVYYWTIPGADEQIGACHAVELAYVFNNPDEAIYTGGKYDEELADTVQNMWVNFARTGDPSILDSSENGIKWEQYRSDTRKTLIIGNEIKMDSDIKSDQRKEIEPLLHHFFNGNYMQMSFNVPQTYRLLAALIAAIVLIAAAIILIIRTIRKRRKRRKHTVSNFN